VRARLSAGHPGERHLDSLAVDVIGYPCAVALRPSLIMAAWPRVTRPHDLLVQEFRWLPFAISAPRGLASATTCPTPTAGPSVASTRTSSGSARFSMPRPCV